MVPSKDPAGPTSDFERAELIERAVKRSMVMGQLMRRVARQMRYDLADEHPSDEAARAGRNSLAEAGRAQFFVLHVLSKAGPLAVGDIAERCHVSGPTISRMLNQLEANGLIERHIDPTNRRVIRVAATAAGRAAEVEMTRRFEVALQNVLAPLTDDELADLIRAFGHLERLVADYGDATPVGPRSTTRNG